MLTEKSFSLSDSLACTSYINDFVEPRKSLKLCGERERFVAVSLTDKQERRT